MTSDLTTKKVMPIGAMFAKVGENGKWRLGDIKANEGTLNYKTEYLMELNPTDGSVAHRYCYLDQATINKTFKNWPAATKATAVGWWDWNTVTAKTGFTPMGTGSAVKADDEEFDLSTGFRANFAAGLAALKFSGEVPTGGEELDYTGMKSFPLVNCLPRQITLGELKATEGTLNYKTEYLIKLNPADGSIVARYCYLDQATINKTFKNWPAATKATAVGWWDWNTVTAKTGFTPMGTGSAVKADDVTIEPGEGFVANFAGAIAKITFPKSVVDVAK